ncbi:MAG: hypothetical protein Q8R44_14875, partial [Novosphingobium sp.]|nr:hypothetical protein [Novosphingobium sp.]
MRGKSLVGWAGLAAAAAGALAWWSAQSEDSVLSDTAVTLTVNSTANSPAPHPLPTRPATLSATLRAQAGPPSPEPLRDNPQAQAAYDASAKPGDYVTPPSVSVEH